MIDINKTGANIARLRRAADLTQSALAEKLCVSFQAVSNWERGQTLPDIDKLCDMCVIFGVSLEELIGSERAARAIEAVKGEDKIDDPADFAEIAPLVKPSDAEHIAGDCKFNNIKELAEIAPFLSEETLSELVRGFDGDGYKISDIVPLAPFLDEDELARLADKAAADGVKSIVPLAPFLDDEYLGKYVQRAIDKEISISELAGLAPFLDEDDLARLVGCVDGESFTVSDIIPLAPFMDDETVDALAEKAAPSGIRGLAGLAPFMSDKALGRVVENAVADGARVSDIMPLAPFLDERALKSIARKILSRDSDNSITPLTPFM